MGFILLIIASLLKWILTPVAYVYGLIVAISKGEFSQYNEQLALAKDRYGNVLCQYLFNQIFIKSEGYKYGVGKETISSVLGKNERDGTLLHLGKFILLILNSLEENHCKNSIDINP